MIRKFMLACLLVSLATGCGGTKQKPPGPGARTLNYWNAVSEVFKQCSTRMNGQPSQEVKALRDAAATIQQMPTLGIDPAVVGWALRAAMFCEQRANLTENSSDPGVFVEALVRGLNGEPFRVSGDLLDAVQQLQKNYQSVRQDGIELRARLTAHYRIEFPPTTF